MASQGSDGVDVSQSSWRTPRLFDFKSDCHERAAADVFHEAYTDDPVLRHVFQDDDGWHRVAAELGMLMQWVADTAYNGVQVAGEHGAPYAFAWWIPCETHETWGGIVRTLWVIVRLKFLLSRSTFDRMQRVRLELEARKKAREAIGRDSEYLLMLGTHPSHQGTGLGSELLCAGAARAAKFNRACYLEATTERSMRLYKRHGFQLLEKFHVNNGKGPPMWAMYRPCNGTS